MRDRSGNDTARIAWRSAGVAVDLVGAGFVEGIVSLFGPQPHSATRNAK
jgi:hypothetical protein